MYVNEYYEGELKKIDSFSSDLSLYDARRYMTLKLNMALHERIGGQFLQIGGKLGILAKGYWSEDKAFMEFFVKDGEYYATHLKKYCRGDMYYDKPDMFHIPRVWLGGSEDYFNVRIKGLDIVTSEYSIKGYDYGKVVVDVGLVVDGIKYATRIELYSGAIYDEYFSKKQDVEQAVKNVAIREVEKFRALINRMHSFEKLEDFVWEYAVRPVVEFCKDGDLEKYEGYAYREIRENLIMRYEMRATGFTDYISNALLEKMNATEEDMYGLFCAKFKDRPLFLAYAECGEYSDCSDMACASCPMNDFETVVVSYEPELSCDTGVDCFLMPDFYMSSDELLSKVLELRGGAGEMYLIVGSPDGIILTYCDGESVSVVANYMRRKYNKEIFVFRYEKDTV